MKTFENTPRVIKFEIGVKEYDEKVNEFYTQLIEPVHSYEGALSQQIAWEIMIFDETGGEKYSKEIMELYSLSRWDPDGIRDHMRLLSYYDELELKLYSPDNVNVDLELMCFAKAVVFYLCKLEYLRDYCSRNPEEIPDFVSDILLPPENLNFYKAFIEDSSDGLYRILCVDYLDRIKRVDGEHFTNIERDEFSRLLSSTDKGNDWIYLTERFKYHDFHDLTSIRDTVNKLLNGYYYDMLFLYGENKIIMSEVLAIQKYVDFLNVQLQGENRNESVKELPPVSKHKEERSSFRLVEKEKVVLDLDLLRDKLKKGRIISDIKDEKFNQVFDKITTNKINFVRKDGGLTEVFWFMYFMREEFELIDKDVPFRKQIKNCFLVDNKVISTTDGVMSTMLAGIRKPYYDERGVKGKKIKNFTKYSAAGNKNLTKTELNTNIIFDAICESIIPKREKNKI